jgi:hypothetical protein
MVGLVVFRRNELVTTKPKKPRLSQSRVWFVWQCCGSVVVVVDVVIVVVVHCSCGCCCSGGEREEKTNTLTINMSHHLPPTTHHPPPPTTHHHPPPPTTTCPLPVLLQTVVGISQDSHKQIHPTTIIILQNTFCQLARYV